MASTRFLNQKDKDILPWAVALEMVHTASLIHDDLPCMDDETNRRGKTCLHLVYGEDMALLAGSTLFIEAFYLVSQLKSNLQELSRLLVQHVGFYGIMQGQVWDLRLSKEKKKKHHMDFIRLKTGSLIQACLEGPAILWAQPKERKALKKLGRFLGPAYQLADDLLDKDCLLVSQKQKWNLLDKLTEQSLQVLKPFGKKADALSELVNYNRNRVKR